MQHDDGLIAHIRQQISDFRHKLLDLTLLNPLISFRHNERAATHVRIVDELPDVVFEKLESGSEMAILALEPPHLQPSDEDTEEFIAALNEFKRTDQIYREEYVSLERSNALGKRFDELERKARDRIRFRLGMPEWKPELGLKPEELARRRGFDPSYDLPRQVPDSTLDRHRDDGLQTLHFIDQLEAKLRGLHERARSSVRETGIPILFAAFGFLEWYEDENSDRAHYAPLLLLPLEMNRQRRGQRYRYFVTSLDQPPRSNITLARLLEYRFGLILPTFEDDDTPESYFAKVESLCKQKPRWKICRFLTIGVFPFSKLAVYEDLDLDENWKDPSAFLDHPAMTALIASAGDAESPFGDDYAIDEPTKSAPIPRLIYDADSSQHSAIIDVLSGSNLAIHGPPGTGKSQTITNIIAAAIAAGKSVLFAAEKLAALEVVADRLNKAGLAEFCLNLHGRSIRKSEVLASLKARLEMAKPTFDAVQYNHDIEAWTAQRDALKRYAQIMNQPVGRLNMTIHEILWRNIEKKERLASIPNALRRLELPRTAEIVPPELRKAQEALVTLEDSYRAAVEIVADMATHPWRGVRRVDLTPFDVTVACDLAGDWATALVALKRLVDDVFMHAASCRPTFGEAVGWLHGLQRLPRQLPPLCLHHASSIYRGEFRAEITRFVQVLQTIERASHALHDALRIGQLEALDGATLERLHASSIALGVSDMTSSQVLDELTTAEKHFGLLSAARAGLEQTIELFGIEGSSDETLRTALAGACCVESTDRKILLGRTDQLINEMNGTVLREAQILIDTLKQRRVELSARFHLGNLPNTVVLKKRSAALRTGGPLKAFRKEVRSAKMLYRQLCKSANKRSQAQMVDDFEDLAQYVEAANALTEDKRIVQILGDEFRGVDTDMSDAMRVHEWAAEVVNLFPGIDPNRQAVRETLLRGDIALLDEIQNVWSAIPDSLRQSVAHGEKSLDAVQEDEKAANDRVEQLRRLYDGLISIALAPDRKLADLELLSKLLSERKSACAEATSCTAAETFFGKDFRGIDTDITPHYDALSALAALDQSGLPDQTCASLLSWARRNNSDLGTLQETTKRSLDKANDLWKRLTELLEIDVVTFIPESVPEAHPLEELIDRAHACAAAPEALTTWRMLQTDLNTAQQTVGRTVIEAYESANEPFTGIGSAFDCILCRSLANQILRDHPELQRLSGHQLTNHQRAFADLDEKILALERRRIASELCQRPIEAGVGIGRPSDYSERALIQHHVSLRRSTLPLRQILSRASTAARQLKPCFMMSPLTIAQFLPRTTELFDLVIIDEASQMRPEDAFGAIVRGKQCVVVGDPMQLPPTSFFETSFWSSANEDDVDDRLFQQVDSILDLALRAFRPTRYLHWHYRSRHSGLIAFSNRQFYDNKLVVFPGAYEDDPESGVHFQHSNGTYAGSRNITEAEAVVETSLTFMTSPRTRNLSLGVVAINQSQRDLLEELFDRAFAQNVQADRYRQKWESTLYPFFIKNLENVQGDERDAIFISMTYGPDSRSGTVYQRFGPITWPGGHRRLNVLFTRARRLIRVFSSMTASDIQISDRTSEGTRILRDYLDYAATGRLDSGLETGRLPDSPFEEFVKGALEAQGYIVTPQVGVAGYRIDLGVRHPDYPHGYILGVECDGATYHSAKSVRDRDRLRQMVLEGLGWEIYRIWSTDWFHDPERELGKLVEHLSQRIDQVKGGIDDVDSQTKAKGLIDVYGDRTPEPNRAADQTDSSASTSTLEEDRPIVEIGDEVTCEYLNQPGKQRKVKIVSGPDAPDQDIISDAKPLAIALLSAAEGEVVTVEQPPHSIDVKVRRIEKSLSNVNTHDNLVGGTESGESRDSDVSPSDRLHPYISWQGKGTPDPRTTAANRVDQALFEIIECEGPVLVARVYSLYAKACGLRVGGQVKSSLNRALSRLVRAKRVILENEHDKPGQVNSIVRVAGYERIRLRELGPRTLAEIPPSEISAHMRLLKDAEPDSEREELFRTLLSRYGLARLTSSTRSILNQVARSVYI